MTCDVIDIRVTPKVTGRYSRQQAKNCLDAERYDRGWNR